MQHSQAVRSHCGGVGWLHRIRVVVMSPGIRFVGGPEETLLDDVQHALRVQRRLAHEETVAFARANYAAERRPGEERAE